MTRSSLRSVAGASLFATITTLVGCSADTSASDVASDSLAATSQAARVVGVVERALEPADHDGEPGEECAVLVAPEHRLRKIILAAPAEVGACAVTKLAATSFAWADTEPYAPGPAADALRGALGEPGAAVHRLVGVAAPHDAALAALEAFLALAPAEQGAALLGGAGFESVRVHSRRDFHGAAEDAAEAAYQSVAVHGPCEQPGSPALQARVKDGFVYGYVAQNSGSCHSGWFSRAHAYNRRWELVGRREYSE